ncbi:bifunctional methylenetetrahydrofolate dehydrogenase/methenyltetrahydrofolate cyclohydrolase FolD [Mycoplasmatota bacterium]|nr:bifunctional methylenetetrahydrofolate dehydrogenase/methenyltetrahydrofolate cyclohydrolase FolD [Mycoplasmatota bacterium]
MSAIVVSGKDLAKRIRSELKEKVCQFIDETNVVPHLVVVLVGDNPASLSYVTGKQKGCEQTNMKSTLIKLPVETKEEELIELVEKLNQDTDVHGILVQLPLPKHINESKIINTISIEKDVDGFSPINVGKMVLKEQCFLPCTPAGIIKLIKETNIDMSGKHAVILGRSNIVGKPVAHLLLRENATVTICHSRTKDLKSHTKEADIIIAAIGKAKFVTADMIKPGAVVIDVGVNRVDNKLCGDVDFENALDVAGYITPVPGGVGPMTITMLLENTLEACKRMTK